jgi:hypothetical protein
VNDLPFLILFLLIVAFLFRLDFIFYIIYVVTGIYAWSQWHSPRSVARLRLSRSYRDHAFLGEPVTVRVHVENESRLPLPWLQLYDSVPANLRLGSGRSKAISLRGRGATVFSYRVRASRRGYYRLGPMLLTAGDLFGFAERHRQFPADYLTVYPRIIPLEKLNLPSRLPFGVLPSRQRLFEDPARPIGVRDYRAGDSLRHINWKVSAHAENLLVKNFQPAISLDTMILINMNQAEYGRRHRYDGPNWAVVIAASLAAHLASQRQAVGLACNGADPLRQRQGSGGEILPFDAETGRLQMLGQEGGADTERESGPAAAFMPPPVPPRPGRPHLMKVLEILARVEPERTVPFARWTTMACLDLSWGTTIIAITPKGDETTCRALHRLLSAGYNPILIAVEPYANFAQARERARRLGFAAYHVARKEDLRI